MSHRRAACSMLPLLHNPASPRLLIALHTTRTIMPGGVSMFVVKELQAHAAFHAREAFHLKKSAKKEELSWCCHW
jgi:hypothetical protein